MKKILLAFITSVLFMSTAFAQPEGQVSVQPIVDGINARTAALDKTNILAAKGTCRSQTSTDTDIIVINYPAGIPIIAVFPAGAVQMVGSTSARYIRQNYMGYTLLELRNANNQTFWSGYVQYLDTVSVYIDGRNGQYVVYVTHNN